MWQNKRTIVVHAGIVLVMMLAAGTGASTVGGSSGAYLRPSVGAAAMAMGSANTALPDNLSPWWNPAAMAFHKQLGFVGGVGLRSLGRTDAFGSFECKIPPRLGLGLMILYRGDPFLNDLYDVNENPIEDASYTTITGKIAFSYYINRKMSAGLNINIHYQQIPTYIDGSDVGYSNCTNIGSVDLAWMYQINKLWTIAAVIKDLGSTMTWSVDLNNENSAQIEDRPLPSITLGSKYQSKLMGKPLLWTFDVKGFLFDGDLKALERPEGVLNTGLEWRNWEKFYLRAGIGDLLINGYLLDDRDSYFSNFPFRITAGFSLDMERFHKGIKLNYGVSTDKLWAGLDQQLDIQWMF
ncbi:MAG TPA: hypothetical protein VHO70_19235 [Chitinispirillaceae bacterium]|nr:hypothetical protein [Chitinispirillaceae bacterium]